MAADRSAPLRRKRAIRPRSARRAYALIMFVLVVAAMVVGYAVRARYNAVNDDESTWRPGQVAVRELLVSVVEQETAQRGFVITADATFLDPYIAGRARSDELIAMLSDLFPASSRIGGFVAVAEGALRTWQQGSADVEIELVRTDPDAARALVADGVGARRLDEFRRALDHVQVAIDVASHRGQGDRDDAFALLVAATTIGGLALAGAGAFGVRRVSVLREQRERLTVAERELRNDNVRIGTERDRVATLFQSVIDESPVGIAVFDLDNRMIFVNRALAARSRLSRGAQIGRTPAELLPRGLAEEAEKHLKVTAAGERVTDLAVVGRAVDSDRQTHMLVSYYPVLDADGSLIAIGSNVVDVSDQRLIEERLRAIVATLQASLLPRALPQTPGFEIIVDYRAASEDMEVGGDFYDVGVLTDGTVTITVGDVCGHDVEAATVTGMVRHTIAAASQHLADPVVVLGWANRAMLHDGDQFRFATAVFGRLSADTDETALLRLGVAGHPLPIRIRSEIAASQTGSARAEYVGRSGTLLGLRADARFIEDVVQLAIGDQLVFYTDGLFENSRPRLDEAELLRLVQACAANTAAETAANILAAYDALALGERCDDLALMVVRWNGVPVDG